MIYQNSYFRKEVRQAYLDNRIGLRRKLLLGLFVGLVSFSAYFVLQTLKETVISDAAPEIMQPSFFSTIYIYNHAALLASAAYFIVYYDYLFFSEIRRNAWYLLIHLRYRPVRMIAEKMAALYYSMSMVYAVGFAFTALLTVFLKYTFVFAYMPSLFLAGLIDIVLLTGLSTAISLFVKRREDARLLIGGAVILVFIFKVITGIYELLRNRVVMQDINNLFDTSRSWYFPVSAVIIAAGIAVSALRARSLAQYYNIVADDQNTLPAGVKIVRIDAAGRQEGNRSSIQIERRRKLTNTVVSALLIAFIFAALALNVLIILIGTATPGNEVTIRGTIPYVFRSDTMQPSIMINDLAFFRKVDVQYPIQEDQIVLFKDNNIVYVERVTHKTDEMLEVDIDHYPPAAETGAMVKQIPRSAIYGVYSGRSRWLGALILFANTIIGRILFLLVPAVLLFYRKRIAALYRRSRDS